MTTFSRAIVRLPLVRLPSWASNNLQPQLHLSMWGTLVTLRLEERGSAIPSCHLPEHSAHCSLLLPITPFLNCPYIEFQSIRVKFHPYALKAPPPLDQFL
jgi:hypothetical protein